MDRLIRHAKKLMQCEEAIVLAGDFNVIPDPVDAARPELWTGTRSSCRRRGRNSAS